MRAVHGLFSALVLAAMVFTTPAWSQAPAVDPQSLVGSWEGDWQGVSRQSGRYFLTIRRVDGDAVYGTMEWMGSAKQPPFEFKGKLEGDRLVWIRADKQAQVEFTISGTTMTGRSTSTRLGDSRISLTKTK